MDRCPSGINMPTYHRIVWDYSIALSRKEAQEQQILEALNNNTKLGCRDSLGDRQVYVGSELSLKKIQIFTQNSKLILVHHAHRVTIASYDLLFLSVPGIIISLARQEASISAPPGYARPDGPPNRITPAMHVA
jgi:hypothetical protein